MHCHNTLGVLKATDMRTSYKQNKARSNWEYFLQIIIESKNLPKVWSAFGPVSTVLVKPWCLCQFSLSLLLLYHIPKPSSNSVSSSSPNARKIKRFKNNKHQVSFTFIHSEDNCQGNGRYKLDGKTEFDRFWLK